MVRATVCLPLLLAAAYLVSARDSGAEARPFPIQRALWITRWDYRTEDEVCTVVGRAAAAGFDTIFFQVRGNGTVFYSSRLEPWAEELGFEHPGFDPLETACRVAGEVGIAVHAWVNAVPGWRGDRPPTWAGQLYHRRPEWFLYDEEGRRQPLQEKYYVALNPCLPEVREHVAAICEEIVTAYPAVAGVHLDYIRFLEPQPGRDYPRDPRTLAIYRAETGSTPGNEDGAWHAWKTRQVTRLVRLIRERTRRARPGAILTAAVIRTPKRARQIVHQNWPLWLRRGYVDGVCPMQYDRDLERFRRRTTACLRAAGGRPVVMGIGAYLHEDPSQTIEQIEIARQLGATGISIFAYSSFFPSPNDREEKPPPPALRERRRDRIFPALRGR